MHVGHISTCLGAVIHQSIIVCVVEVFLFSRHKPHAPHTLNRPHSVLFLYIYVYACMHFKYKPKATNAYFFSHISISQVYIGLFEPLRVSRHQFKKVLNCMKLIRSLKYQEVYAQEKVTKVDSLSLVLSGK